MRETAIRTVGLLLSLVYAAFLGWMLVTQPRSVAELRGRVTSQVGLYRIDRESFDRGLRFFRDDKFAESRLEFARADPAGRDPVTQFYVAYSWYRQGWGRLYDDDALFREAIVALDRAEAAAPSGRVVVDDPTLGLRTSDELRVELQRGLTLEPSDFNPLRILRERK
jgi:hypothetical protein